MIYIALNAAEILKNNSVLLLNNYLNNGRHLPAAYALFTSVSGVGQLRFVPAVSQIFWVLDSLFSLTKNMCL